MKKTTKSSNSGKTRHSRTTKKPVTIDLKAESVKTNAAPNADEASKPAASNNPAVTGAKKTSTRSVPKVEPKPKETVSKSADSKASSTSAKSSSQTSPGPKSGFGRDPQKESPAKKTEQTASKSEAKEMANTITSPPATPKPSGQWSSRLIAGIVGGVIVLAGSTLLKNLNIWPSSSADSAAVSTLNAANEDLASRLSALETELVNVKSATKPPLEMSAVSAEIEAKFKSSTAETQTKLDDVSSQISKTSEDLKTLEGQLQTTNKALENVDMAAVSEKVATVSSHLDEMTAKAQTIDTRIASLEDTAQSNSIDPKTLATITAMQAAIPNISKTLTKEFSGKLDTVSGRLGAIEKNQESLPDLIENVASMKTSLETLGAGLGDIKQQSEAQQKSLTSLQDETRSIAEAEKKAAGSVAAAALKNDIDNGFPFEVSLKNLQQFTGQSDDIAGLSPFAKSGVPTVATLKKQFDGLSDQIVQASKPKPAGDLSERLLSSVRSFVKSKPIKVIEGSGPQAIVSQISASLTSGDIANASQLWKSLPEASKVVSKSWHDGLQARVTADQLLSNAVQSFLVSTASQ